MEIVSCHYVISSPSLAQCPKPDKPEYAFIGRSNVGKSSLINMITGQKNLAKTSRTPGKTQLINHFLANGSFYLVDLPGYGFAKVSIQTRRNWEKMIEDYLKNRATLVTVFVLIDSRLEPQAADLEFLRKLGEWQVPFNIIFTKADKTTQKEVSANVKLFINVLREEWEFIPRSFVTSAVKLLGKRQILSFIEELNTAIKESKGNLPSLAETKGEQ